MAGLLGLMKISEKPESKCNKSEQLSDKQSADNEELLLSRMIDDIKNIDSNLRMELKRNASKIIRMSKSQLTTDYIATSIASKLNIKVFDAVDMILGLREASTNKSRYDQVTLSISGPKKYRWENIGMVYDVNNMGSIMEGLRALERFKTRQKEYELYKQ